MTNSAQKPGEPLEQFERQLAILKVIHLALVAGVLLFGLVAFILLRGRVRVDAASANPLHFMAYVLAAGSIAISSLLPRIIFRPGAAPPSVTGAVMKYQSFFIARAAVIEGAALFSGVVTLVTGSKFGAGLLLLCAGVLAFRRPSREEFVRLTAAATQASGGRL